MKVKFAVLFVVLFLVGAGVFYTWALLTFTLRIPSVAQVKTVGLDVFEDANLTIPLLSIDWGMVGPGQNVTVPIYVQSTSTMPVSLSLSEENWVPLNATIWIGLSWDYNGSLLQPNDSVPLVLTLTVSENVTSITSFSFDIVIIGEE